MCFESEMENKKRGSAEKDKVLVEHIDFKIFSDSKEFMLSRHLNDLHAVIQKI